MSGSCWCCCLPCRRIYDIKRACNVEKHTAGIFTGPLRSLQSQTVKLMEIRHKRCLPKWARQGREIWKWTTEFPILRDPIHIMRCNLGPDKWQYNLSSRRDIIYLYQPTFTCSTVNQPAMKLYWQQLRQYTLPLRCDNNNKLSKKFDKKVVLLLHMDGSVVLARWRQWVPLSDTGFLGPT